MREQPHDGLSLFGPFGGRKYLNAAERRRFVKPRNDCHADAPVLPCTLRWSGARISEVLALTPAAIDIESGVASITRSSAANAASSGRCPCPDVLDELDRVQAALRAARSGACDHATPLAWSRTTAWRSRERSHGAAGIVGTPAMPKGLRHGFGVNAFQTERAAASGL